MRSALSDHVTVRLLGSDDFPPATKRQARPRPHRGGSRRRSAAAAVGALRVDVGERFPPADIAEAHDRVDAGIRGRVLVHVGH
ncbi:hypothetical protein ACIO93_02675 [Streptomyces sp. NPDC087903]|uniref:hypothetical protein n=1 Tax=Streptomyces sp. NPDC087903 TaxID=3365819 RepID=UPI003802DCA1